jgi:hypothetical protein
MHNLELIAQNFPNISKWTHDPNIDLDTSTNFGPILQLQIHNAHASSNFDITNIWAMLENNYSLAPPSSPKLLVPYGTLLNPTLGNTSYFHVHNNISMPYALNVIIKRFANFENSFYLAIIHDVLFLWMPEYMITPPQTIQSPLGYYLVRATHPDVIAMPISNQIYYVSRMYPINIRPLPLPHPQSLSNL